MKFEFKPRIWQKHSYRKWDSTRRERKHFVNVACPGAGKTSDALMKFAIDREKGHYDKLIVVSPTQKVRKQWVSAASRFGINLAVLSRDQNINMFDGFSMTYQQLAGFYQRINSYCLAKRVMVVLDEPHHLADERTWGEFAQKSFAGVQRMLLATGTPFRSDSARIPFLRYSPDGVGEADFIYGYAEAIVDGYCRVVRFHAIDASISWGLADGEQANMFDLEEKMTASFKDHLEQQDSSKRLRAALHENSPVLKQLIEQSNAKLSELRTYQEDAAGLAVCMNIKHARQVAKLLLKYTGKEPVLVHSDDDYAMSKIDEFSADKTPWIVSVGMVSEGVDIPRLRVLLHATNVKTAMSFRQIIGRIVRRRPGEISEKCYAFLPADPGLLKHVQEIEDEISHVLRKGKELSKKNNEDIEREIERKEIVVFGGEVTDTMVFENGNLLVDGNEIAPVHDLQEYMNRMRKLIQHAVSELSQLTGRTHRQINAEWIRMGGKPTKDATPQDLQSKYAWLRGTLAYKKSRRYYKAEEKPSIFA